MSSRTDGDDAVRKVAHGIVARPARPRRSIAQSNRAMGPASAGTRTPGSRDRAHRGARASIAQSNRAMRPASAGTRAADPFARPRRGARTSIAQSNRAMRPASAETRTRGSRERALRGAARRGASAARHVLSSYAHGETRRATTSRAPVVAARSARTRRVAASFVENFSLALVPARDGIKHGTARNESTPRVRAESILPITQTTRRRTSSPRIKPVRLAVLSPLFPRARPSRSDRTPEGCTSREDQGGPQ